MAKWIGNDNKAWLGDHVPQRPRQQPVAVCDEEIKNTTPDNNSITCTVRHVVLKCPKCRSRKVRCYGADKPVLYYQCMEIKCFSKFKVVEVDEK